MYDPIIHLRSTRVSFAGVFSYRAHGIREFGMLNNRQPAGRAAPAAACAAEMLLLLAETMEPMTVAEMSRRLSVTKSMALRVSAELRSRRLLDDNDQRSWLGLAALELGGAFAATSGYVEAARRVLADLAGRTGETVEVGVLQGDDVLYLMKQEGTNSVPTSSYVGKRLPANCTALGKVLLAGQPDIQHLSEPFERLTPASIATKSALDDELAVVRRQGYATETGKMQSSSAHLAVTVAIIGIDWPTAMSISCSADSFSERRESLLSALREAGAALSEAAARHSTVHVPREAGTSRSAQGAPVSDPADAPRSPAPAAACAADILMLLATTTKALTVSEIARHISVTKSMALRVIGELGARRLVAQDAAQRYRLGLATVELGGAFAARSGFADAVRRVLIEVAANTADTVSVGVLQDDNVLYLMRRTATGALATVANAGRRLPANCCAIGKVLLAQMPDGDALVRMPEPLERLTTRSIATRSQLRAELAHVRKQGYAVEEDEAQELVACVAVPAAIAGLDQPAAMSISTHTFGFSERLPTLLATLQEASAALSVAAKAFDAINTGERSRSEPSPSIEFGIPGFRLEPGDHICAFYSGLAERDEIMASFLDAGLRADDKCLCILDTTEHAMMLDKLSELDRQGRASLEMQSKDDTYLRTGHFHKNEMLTFLEESASATVKSGDFSLTRVVGDATWSIDDPALLKEFVLYETELNSFVSRYPQVVLCLYDIQRLRSNTIGDLLRIHPRVMLGGLLFDNPTYQLNEHIERETIDSNS